jgi:hypothetical protein
MEFKDKIENLSKDIQDINNLLEIIKNNNGISRIEVDILKARIQGLYLSLLELDKKEPESKAKAIENDLTDFERNFEVIESLVPEPEEEVAKNEPDQEDILITEDDKHKEKRKKEEITEVTENNSIKDENIIPDPVTKSGPESIKVQEAEIKNEPEKKIINKADISEEEILDKEKENMTTFVKSQPNSSSKEVVSDMYKNKQKYRNESLQKEKVNSDISAQFHNKPIADIASAIGINDKFRYIRELFSGDSSLYSKAIEFLNTVDSEQKATTYLKENFSLDTKNKLVKQLLDLTRRKLKTKTDG